MVLTEEHSVKKNRKTKELYQRIDAFCYLSKNLYNSVNYLIIQCSRISRKLAGRKVLEEWEQELLGGINSAIHRYNGMNSRKKLLHPVSETNGFIADAYFLSWYLKDTETYRAMPYATCSQICIQNLCKNWKSFYRSMKVWKADPSKFMGMPKRPRYLDKQKGRNQIVLTSQNIRVDGKGNIRMPRFLDGLHIRARHHMVRQVRIRTLPDRILVQLMYEQEEMPVPEGTGVMGIDPGVNNLLTICFEGNAAPVIINGRPVKSVNQYYNKRKAELQSAAKRSNRTWKTKRMQKLTVKRNNKIKDYLHKASRKVIRLAIQNGVGTIVIGRNYGWKQDISLGNITNQNFVAIPYRILIEMIRYKAALIGIRVLEVNEAYTSGTSYLDREKPEACSYNKSRRIHRGLFRSSTGKEINADVNAGYQIMKKAGYCNGIPKEAEPVRRIQVA